MYWLTLATNVTLEWSGMLSTGAMYGGVPAVTGYPVWVIYSWCFIHLLPFSNIAWRVAIGSAVASALTCGLIALMVSRSGEAFWGKTAAACRLKPARRNLLRGSCGVLSALMFGFSRAFWNRAVLADTWALSFLMLAGAICLLMRWMFEPEYRRFLFGSFFMFGLLLTSNQEMIIMLPGLLCGVILTRPGKGRDVALLTLPLLALVSLPFQHRLLIAPGVLNWPLASAFGFTFFIALVVLAVTRRVGTEWKIALGCTGCLLLGLGFYFYMPLSSMTTPPVNWGYPRRVEGFLHVLTRGQYENVQATNNLSEYARQFAAFLRVGATGFGWWCLLLAVLPMVLFRRLGRVGRHWLLSLVAVWICAGPLTVWVFNAPPDRQVQGMLEIYYVASNMVLALCAGIGLIILGESLSTPSEATTSDS